MVSQGFRDAQVFEFFERVYFERVYFERNVGKGGEKLRKQPGKLPLRGFWGQASQPCNAFFDISSGCGDTGG